MKPEQADSYARILGDTIKYSLILIIMCGAFYMLYKKLGNVTYAQVKEAFLSIPPTNIAIAVVLTCANFCLLTDMT